MTTVKRSYYKYVLSLLVCFNLFACATSSSVGSFESPGDAQLLFEDEKRMWGMSEEASENFRMAGLLYEDEQLNSYLQSISDKLFPDFKDQITVQSFKSSDLNAFAMPNGSVYVNIGLLARMDNEAQLASVLAHEGFHYIQRHGVKRTRSAKSKIVLGGIIGAAVGVPALGSVFAYSSIAGFSRANEDESDTMGFERLYDAGYKVEEGAEFFSQVARENKALENKHPFFFASHPKMEERAKNFEELAKVKSNANGYLGVEEFRRITQQATLDALDEELSKGNEKLLRFILEDEERLQHLPTGSRFYLGEAYRIKGEEGDRDRARQEYEKTILDAPSYPPPYSALGLLQMKDGDNNSAIANFTTYLSLAPNAKNSGYIKQYLEQLKGQE